MKYENRISRAQQKFLLAVRDGTLTLAQLKKQMEVKEAQFGRWMRNPFYRAELFKILLESSRQRFVELELAAKVAVDLLRRSLSGEFVMTAEQLLLCRTIIELAQREGELRRRRRAHAKRKKKMLAKKGRELCHPSVSAERGEMLRKLKALR